MIKKLSLILLSLLLSLQMGCEKTPKLEQLSPPETGEEIAIITTNMGEMKLRFFPDVAPKAVENFKTLAKDEFYNGLTFDRVELDFLIQVGEHPEYKHGKSIFEAFFEDETHDDYRHFTGAVGLAKSADNQNNSNFYMIYNRGIEKVYLDAMRELYDMGYPKNIVDAYEVLGGVPRLDSKYTIFAQVFDGLDVLESINQTEVNIIKIPVNPVIIESIKIIPYQ